MLDGYTYAAQYTNNPAQVVAGQVARLEVRWAAADGKLRVTIDGAPPGGAPRVAVQGDGFGTTLTQSALLTGLAPGKYTVTPEPFRYGAYTYAGVAAPADPTVFAGSETTVGVRYAPQTGALAVTLTPPPGGSPAVVVTGPNGYRNTLTGSATLEDLEPGAYALEAPPVTIDGIRYAPRFAPDANPTVTAGQTAQVEVAYAAENALLEVGIEPAPNGQAAVEVRDAAGRVVATLAQSQTLDLEPGQYTLVAQPVWVGPDVYRPTPDTVTVDLAAGAREAASFTYAAWSGTLEVTVTGLPQGAQADVVVTGPNNYRKKLTGSATLTGLAPGQYTLAPNPVTAGADRYEAAAQTVAVASGQTTRAAVRYARATATLRVDATGLPAGVTADVRLNGPDPDLPPRVTVPPQRVLAGLEPGSYTLAAPDVTAGGFTYRASPATQAVTLARGDDRTVTPGWGWT